MLVEDVQGTVPSNLLHMKRPDTPKEGLAKRADISLAEEEVQGSEAGSKEP